MVDTMTDQNTKDSASEADVGLPVFPAAAPDSLTDPATAIALLEPVLDQLAAAVVVPDDLLDRPTPCRRFTVGELRNHVLGWLQFFAAALDDPAGETERLDPDAWQLADADEPAALVDRAARTITAAVDKGVGAHLVTMSQARMRGDAVVAMALGEYIVHGWDLSVSTGRAWSVVDDAAEQARLFLQGVVAPEYRGEEHGFFADEVPVADDAPALDRLLGFAGRNPAWRPAQNHSRL